MKGNIASLSRIAARQHGLFTAEQARASGMTPRGLAQLVASGWCEHPHPRVYQVRAAAGSQLQRILRGVLAAGPGAVASHRAAASIWELPGYRTARSEVTRPNGLSQRAPWGTIHGSTWLPPAHVVRRHEIPVTTPGRTAFDLAGVVSAKRLERDVDHLLHRRVLTIGQLQQTFFALARRGRRGTVAMRAMLDVLDADRVVPASELERRARALLAAERIAQPRFEVSLGDEDWIGRVDCLWEEAKVIVELDGRRFHGGLVARDADRRRDNRLMAAGWRVLRLTWDDLIERPQEAVAWIRDALAA